MFTRPTIDWSLQCELDGKTRNSADTFDLKFESTGADRKSKAFAITALIFQLLPLATQDALWLRILGTLPNTLGFLMRPTLKYWEWKDSLARDLENVEQSGWFNTCVEEHSQMNADVLAS